MFEYHLSQLNSREQMYYKILLKSISRGESIVRLIPPIGSELLLKIIKAINYDHPELFHVDFRHITSYMSSMESIYQVKYAMDSSLKDNMIKDIEKCLDDIMQLCYGRGLTTDYEKIRWIHNYLVRNIRYNNDAIKHPDMYPDAFTIKGVFLDHLAVCEGISKAFKILCDRMGVDSLVAYGTASLEGLGEENSHAWNIVRIYNEFSHIDVTWDIGVSEPCRYTRYDYYCLTDDQIRADHDYDRTLFPKCFSNRFSYFYKRNRLFFASPFCRKLQD